MVSKALHHLNSNTVHGQLVRYAISGGAVTAIGGALYLALVLATTIDEQVAMLAAYLVCVAIGYVIHSRWSFRGHGSRDNPGKTTSRFFIASLISYALNAAFTWALVRGIELPRWTPVLTTLFVTPVIMFVVNRRWVFA
ncbi:GtrA family protein [Sphingomonas sp.]|uniref:GtrA family protein n=1 Tax=Sphingomonas sp. TaxID=28214 RepID=UPI002DD62B13|nr:GtrA family protein [Sphingomonas sp.]